MFLPATFVPVVSAEETSSLENDSQHDPEKDSQLGAFETQSVHSIHDAPDPIRGCGGSGVYSRGREVQEPYKERQDVGAWAVYVANWGGRRKERALNNHSASDLVARSPAQIVLAQEVDPKLIRTLEDPSASAEAKARPWRTAQASSPAVAGKGKPFEERAQDLTTWHVAAGDEGQGSNAKGLIIAAREGRATASTMVEHNKMFHREYRNTARSIWHTRASCARRWIGQSRRTA